VNIEGVEVLVYDDRAALGRAAGRDVAEHLRRLLEEQVSVAAVFASAPSQTETLAALTAEGGIDWSRLTAFHLDEYLGVRPEEHCSFRRYLRENLLDRVPVGEFHGMRGEAPDAGMECARYAALLAGVRLDFALLGIGENGHLAFNDPPVADFADPVAVKVVELDERCRSQQVHDRVFASLDDVPRQAITLTIPAIMRAPRLFVAVPGKAKAEAVREALLGPISTACPASVLRRQGGVRLYLDRDSAAGLS
jgi:glucosamine-6-phosphate deaminase